MEIVIFRLYFKVIPSEDDWEISSKYHNSNNSFVLLLPYILSFQDDIIFRNMFYCALFEVVAGQDNYKLVTQV